MGNQFKSRRLSLSADHPIPPDAGRHVFRFGRQSGSADGFVRCEIDEYRMRDESREERNKAVIRRWFQEPFEALYANLCGAFPDLSVSIEDLMADETKWRFELRPMAPTPGTLSACNLPATPSHSAALLSPAS